MTTTETNFDSLLRAVTDAIPTLRANGQQTEELRWLPAENLALLDQAGTFRAAIPGRFGGLDLSVSEQATVITEIAKGCPSTGWVASVWLSSTWLVTLFPEQAQQEVFSATSVRTSGGFTPTGSLKEVEGGYLLNGSWRFNTGCRGADWNITATFRDGADGHEEVVALVPMSEFTLTDDWDTSAGAGTGSCTSTARDVFVPEHRVVSFGDAIWNTTPGRTNVGITGRNYGLFSYIMAATVPALLGCARGALDLFLDRLPGRGIAYTDYTDQSAHPLTQVQVATAANKIAAAEALQTGWLAILQARADAGEQPLLEEKIQIRGQGAFAVELAREAVDILYRFSGATSIQRAVPIQRFFRDITGFSLHGFLFLPTNLELQGKALLGKDVETPLL